MILILPLGTFSDLAALDRRKVNALLRHHLRIFQLNDNVTNFCEIFQRWLHLISSRFQDFDTETISEMIAVIKHCCLEVQALWDTETKFIPSEELRVILKTSLYFATGLIMKLYKKGFTGENTGTKNKEEQNLAKNMLRDLLRDIPQVGSPLANSQIPVQHIIITMHLKKGGHVLFGDSDVCQLLVELIDINEACGPHSGNTLLIFVGSFIKEKGDSILIPAALKLIRSLIDKGAHIYARNRKRETIIDLLKTASQKTNLYKEEIQKMIQDLQSLVPSLMTIAAMAVKDSGVHAYLSPGDIPEELKEFLDLH